MWASWLLGGRNAYELAWFEFGYDAEILNTKILKIAKIPNGSVYAESVLFASAKME